MNKMRAWILGAVLACALLAGGVAWAQTGSGYDLTWSTIDGGGTSSLSGGSYDLGGATGQYDAGTLSAGAYVLTGGFWGGAGTQYRSYLPIVTRNIGMP